MYSWFFGLLLSASVDYLVPDSTHSASQAEHELWFSLNYLPNPTFMMIFPAFVEYFQGSGIKATIKTKMPLCFIVKRSVTKDKVFLSRIVHFHL